MDRLPRRLALPAKAARERRCPTFPSKWTTSTRFIPAPMAAGFEIIYGITDEPWGVRRFFVRDPFGKIVNILSHR